MFSKNGQVLATEAEARIHAARETALAAETSLEATQEEARDLRKNHENAMIALAAEMAEKQRRGKEGVAARLQVKQSKFAVHGDKTSLRWGIARLFHRQQ